MSKKLVQIQESQESAENRKNELFRNDIFKSANIPATDTDGYIIGTFTGFELKEPTGEIRKNKDGSVWTDKRAQIEFTFTIPLTDGNTMNVKFWTGTLIDGVKTDGKFSKLVTWLIAIGGLDETILHPKFKVEPQSIMDLIKSIFECQFKFQIIQEGRLWTPVLESFELYESDDDVTE
jgi:hypothetical protein